MSQVVAGPEQVGRPGRLELRLCAAAGCAQPLIFVAIQQIDVHMLVDGRHNGMQREGGQRIAGTDRGNPGSRGPGAGPIEAGDRPAVAERWRAVVVPEQHGDLTGNVGTSPTLQLQIAPTTGDLLPFETTQVVWVRTDLDRDGNADLVELDGTAIRTLFGNGAGGWTAGPTLPARNTPWNAALGDVDGDGFADIALCSFFNEQVQAVFPGAPVSKDGYLWANEAPGWGIEVVEKEAAKFPFGHTEVGERQRLNGGWGTVRRRDGAVIKQ